MSSRQPRSSPWSNGAWPPCTPWRLGAKETRHRVSARVRAYLDAPFDVHAPRRRRRFANNYKNFGAALEFVTNRSQEGSQFVKGFGGIGGILRYKVDFMEHEYDDDDPY